MFSTISLLVLACAITVNAQDKNAQCVPAQIGVVPTGHPVKLPLVVLQPFIADWEVTIPNDIPGCPYGIVGSHAFACDGDVAPTAYFTDLHHLRIHRNGNNAYKGSVLVTVHC